jgi:hypothetical protein
MHWEMASALVAFASAVAAAFSAYTLAQARLEVANALLQMHKEFAQMRVDHAEAYSELYIGIRQEFSEFKASASRGRVDDRDELRTWINGSFMRSKEAMAHLSNFEDRLREYERRA